MNFEDFQQAIETAAPAELLTQLSQSLERDQQYSAWFEALKLQARFELGLEPWNLGQPEDLPADVQRQLEDRLVDACRTVGERLLAAGRIAEGWMYLRPVGDAVWAEQLVRGIAVTDDNVEQVIEVAVGHGVAPAYGFGLLLQRMGTCNAITAFDSQLAQAPLEQRQQAAAALVRHLYDELRHQVVQHGQRWLAQASSEPGSPAVADVFAAAEADPAIDLLMLLQACPELMANDNYHIDTSHLSSVVRIGRIVDDAAVQPLAWQLCAYGQRLAALYQPQGEPVFDPYYVAHQSYYELVMGQGDEQQGLEFFRQRRAELTAAAQSPSVLSLEGQIYATDVLVELLMRRQRYAEAIEVLADQLRNCGEHQRSRWTALLFRCCHLAGDFVPMQQLCQGFGDAFGFGLAAFYQKLSRERS